MNSLAGKVFGRYYLLEQIGLGGMATVYKGLDLDTDRKVALKILAPTMARTPQFKARFEREIKLLRSLKHPNIVPILSFGEEDGHSYIVMPFYPNGTLQDRLGKGVIGPREGARLMNHVSSALDFAHRQGIVHRDVKPSNILLDEEGNAMLSDFGFAQVQDSSLSLTGSALIGTPAYMSPEQCKGDPVDARSDQYALGVILHQLTTGKLPFDADTPMGLVVKHVNAPLTPPRLISPNLPEGVEAVLVKAMAKEPAHRFSSVGEMNRVFQRSLAEAFDSQGRLKPQRTATLPTPLPTEPLPGPVFPSPTPMPVARPWYRQRGLVLASLLLLFACPSAALAFGNGTLAGWLAGASSTPDLVGTIYALSTQISGEQGIPQEFVATAVFQTMVAGRAFGEDGGPGSINVAAPGEWTPAMSPTPTAPGAGGSGWQPTSTRTSPPPTNSGSGPTWTPTRTPTPTDKASDTPGPSPTDAPTDIPDPTATDTPPPPPPTDTPAPPPTINPQSCNATPGKHNYCTPTP